MPRCKPGACWLRRDEMGCPQRRGTHAPTRCCCSLHPYNIRTPCRSVFCVCVHAMVHCHVGQELLPPPTQPTTHAFGLRSRRATRLEAVQPFNEFCFNALQLQIYYKIPVHEHFGDRDRDTSIEATGQVNNSSMGTLQQHAPRNMMYITKKTSGQDKRNERTRS